MEFEEAQKVGRALRSIEVGDIVGLLAAATDPELAYQLRSAALAALEAVFNMRLRDAKELEEDFALRVKVVEDKLRDIQQKETAQLFGRKAKRPS